MSSHNSPGIISKPLLALGVGLLLQFSSNAACAARQQETRSSQSQQQSAQQEAAQPPETAPAQTSATPAQQPAPKHKKVWTNDDVVSLRSPADNYVIEKEAREAAVAKAAVREEAIAKLVKKEDLAIELPSTMEKTQELIDTKQSQISDLQDGMDLLNKDLPGAAPDRKPGMEKQIEILKADIEKANLEIKLLKDHLKDLANNKPSEPSPAPPTPPSPQNPL